MAIILMGSTPDNIPKVRKEEVSNSFFVCIYRTMQHYIVLITKNYGLQNYDRKKMVETRRIYNIQLGKDVKKGLQTIVGYFL